MPIYLNRLDEMGRRVVAPQRPGENFAFVARARDRFSDMTEAWGPEDIASALRDAEEGDFSKKADLMIQMEEKDGALAGFMQTRRLAPAGLKWSILAADDSPQAKRAQEMAMATVRQIPGFRWAIIDLADAVGKGVSCMAIDWTRDGGIAGLRHIHPKRYRWHDKTDQFMIVPDKRDEFSPDPEPIIPEPFQVVIHQSKMRSGHPSRSGALTVVTWSFMLRNFTFKDWVTFSEIFGMPLRIGKYPFGASEGEKAALLEAVRLLGSDAAAIISEDTEIQFTEAVNRGNQPYSVLADAMRGEMALAILGQELTNTVGPNGARAQAQVHNEVRHDILAADCEDLQETITRDLIFPIVGWKLGWDVAEKVCPTFKFDYEPNADYKVQAEVDRIVLKEMGLGRHVTIGWVAQRYGIQLAEGVDPEERLTDTSMLEKMIPDGGQNPAQDDPSQPSDGNGDQEEPYPTEN